MKDSKLISFFNQYSSQKRGEMDLLQKFPPLILKDGIFLSVQYGPTYFSSYGSEDLLEDEEGTVEVYTSDKVVKLIPFDGDQRGTYFNVPISILDTIIEEAGGIDNNAVDNWIAAHNK